MAFKIFENDGLVQTNVHGLEQEAYVVTEERMNSFNNYSFDLQLNIALFSLFFGALVSSFFVMLTTPNNQEVKIIFYCSLSLSILLALFLIMSYLRFKTERKKLFIKMTELPKILEKLLKIVSAKYGTREKNIDISLELSKKISNDSLEVKITNDIAGGIDPAPGIRKTAFIEYYFNGEKKNVEILENEILKLP